MIKFVFILLLSTSLFAEYSEGDQISTDHQNLAFDVCYGDYATDQLSLSDFADGNTVIWINMSASW
jgi:hypothetical protein